MNLEASVQKWLHQHGPSEDFVKSLHWYNRHLPDNLLKHFSKLFPLAPEKSFLISHANSFRSGRLEVFYRTAVLKKTQKKTEKHL